MNLNKNLVFLFTGRLLQIIVSIASIRLMTEYLTLKEVGNQYLINSMILWFSMVLINPVGMYVNRHVHEWVKNKQIFSYLVQLNFYFSFIAILSLPLLYLIQNYFKVGSELSTAYILVYVFLYIFLSTWFQTLVSFFNLFELQKYFVLLNVFSQLTGLVLAIFLVKVFSPSAFSWLFGLLTGQTIALLLAGYLFKNKFINSENKYNKQSCLDFFSKQTFHFCYPIAVATIFMWFLNQGYRIFIEKIMGAEALASIGVGLGLAASLASVVESMTTQFFYPKYYSALANSTFEQRVSAWLNLWNNSLYIYIPFCFLTLAVAPVVVKLLTAVQFHHVVSVVFFGAFIELFRQLSNIAYLASHAEKKTKNTIKPYAFGAVSLVVLLLIVASFHELLNINFVLLSLVIAGAITLILNLYSVKNLLKLSFNYKLTLMTMLCSSPLLVFLFLLNSEQSTVFLLLMGALAGCYCLLIVFNKFIDLKVFFAKFLK